MQITIPNIITAICEHFCLREDDLYKASRKSEIVKPRHLAIFLIKELKPKTSCYTLRDRFKYSDHTSILSAIKNVKHLIICDYEIRTAYTEIKSQFA
jgi:chromosomal replication initiator protein